MPTKHNTTEPSWRPLAQKLTGLIGRRSSQKGKNLPELADEKNSVFRFKRQKKALGEAPLEFKPLEVEFDALDTLNLPEGWLETDRDAANGRRPPPTSGASPTPIADRFASKSNLDLLSTATEDPVRAKAKAKASSPPSHGDNAAKRPFSMVEARSSAPYAHAFAGIASTAEAAQSTSSILDRGRPVEPKHFLSDPPRGPKGSRHDLPPDTVITIVPPRPEITQVARPRDMPPRSRLSKPATAAVPDPAPRLQPVESAVSIKRHSMFEGLGTSGAAPPRTTPTLAPRSVSATPADRIQAWQKNVTVAPATGASVGAAPAGISINSSAPPQTNPLARKSSTRSTRGVSDRLAWIRELESKKSNGVNRDIGVLKKQAGSVSDKLAMFESKQTSAPPLSSSRLPPLTRSNSTSRYSAAGLESIFSSNSNVNTASPRTSIDTVRSNNRASSVMSYYDDSFREKMETLVGGYGDGKPSPSEPQGSAPAPKEPETSVPVPAEPEHSVPALAEPKTSSPAPIATEAIAPAPAEPQNSEPAPTETEADVAAPAEPETIAAAPIEPETISLASAEPEAVVQAPAQPETVSPAPIEPETDVPAPAELEHSEPAPAEPETIAADPAEPENSEPVPAEPETSVPALAEPENSEPAPAEPETSVPALAEPEDSESAPAEPESNIPAPAEPQTSEPATTQPEHNEAAPAEPESSVSVPAEAEATTLLSSPEPEKSMLAPAEPEIAVSVSTELESSAPAPTEP